MLSVNDMFMTAKERIKSFFWDDVNHFLEQNEVRFSPSVEFTGKSGYVHKFDFLIPRSRRKPERILKAINHPSRDAATSLIFAWTDSKDARPSNSQAYAVLNDAEVTPSQEVLSALEHYDIKAIAWTARNSYVPELVA